MIRLLKVVIKTASFWMVLLLSALLFVIDYFKYNPMVADFIENNIAEPYRRFAGVVFGVVSFSVTELLYILGGVLVIVFIARSVIIIIKHKGKRVETLIKQLLTAVACVLAVMCGGSVLWGVGYYADSPVVSLGVAAEPVSVEELTAVTRLFAEKLSETADLVERDENDLFAEPVDVLLEEGYTVYDNLEGIFPILKGEDITAKPMRFSFFMSELNYTGFYFALTGEPNVNVDQPAAMLPSTIAHELAHARGIMPEQDCNFVAILACEYSDSPAYQYSGQLLGYINLSNALYGADNEEWQEISESLHPYVLADLRYNNEYWAQYEGPVSEVADTIYDGYLQSHGQQDGIKSYGMVTDLLIDWYYEETAV